MGTLGGLFNFIRTSKFYGTERLNKLMEEAQELTPELKGDTIERRIVKIADQRIRTLTSSTDNDQRTVSENRGVGATSARRKKPETVKSYPLAHSTTGTITFAGDSSTKLGGGGGFDGSSYITVTDHANLDVTDEITIALWLKPVANTGTDLLVSKDQQYELYITGTNSLEFRTYSGGAWRTALNYTYTSDIGNWISVIAVYDTTNGTELFIDNVSQDSDALTGAMNTTSNDLKIGGDGTSNMPNGTEISHLTMIHAEVNATWRTNFENGVIDTSDGNDEILTIPFVATEDPKPDATSGECRST